MSAREKIAYLKGLIDGQNLADSPQKVSFYAALVDALESLADSVEEHDEVHKELNDYLEQLDEDVAELEDTLDVFLEDDFDDYDDEDYDDEDEEEEFDSVSCPYCGKDFFYEPAAYDDGEELLCPHCGKGFMQKQDDSDDIKF